MYEEYNPYQNTYSRGGYMPYMFQEDNRNSYGYLADDLEEEYGSMMQNPYWYNQMITRKINNMTNLEEIYPEIYKIIYPMVKKACNRNIKGISKDKIDEMTEEIYNSIETDNIVNLNINVENVGTENRCENNKEKENIEIKKEENRSIEHRQQRRGLLFDLIKILLIRELLDKRPGNRPRPPMPPRPPRPGPWENDFLGRPPMPRY